MEFKKSVIALASVFVVSGASAQAIDLSLSANGWENITGQSFTGTQSFQAGPNAWAISPYTGSTMYGLEPTSPANTYSNMSSALGLSQVSVSALSAEIAAQNPSGGGSITNASWVSKNFTFGAPATFKMYWVYTSTDYVPFNDGSITTLVNTTNASTFGKINGVTTQYLLLGATNPGTGNYSTGSYGSTGWQVANYEVVTAGTYKLGFAVFNQGDTALSPKLFVNDGLGTVTNNGTTFGAVAPNNPNMPTVDPTPPAPTAPTVVSQTTTNTSSNSSINGTPNITNEITYGTAAYSVEQSNSKGDRTPKVLNVVQKTVETSNTPFTVTTTTRTPVTTTTTTTPVITKTWSDGTTTTENGTPVVTTTTSEVVSTTTNDGKEIIQVDSNKTFQTRIDQFEQLDNINRRLNASLNSDPLSRSLVSDGRITSRSGDDRTFNFYINANGQKSNNVDGYNYRANTFGMGVERRLNPTFMVGAQFNHVDASLYGNNSGGGLTKDAFGLYALKTFHDFILKADLGYAVNKYGTNHTLPELGLANSATANGNDAWASLRAYTPNFYGFRPFVGGRVENNKRGSSIDGGSAVSAVDNAAFNSTQSTGEAGVRYEKLLGKNWTAVAEAGANTAKLNTYTIGALYATTSNSSIVAKLSRQEQNGVAANQAMLIGRVNF